MTATKVAQDGNQAHSPSGHESDDLRSRFRLTLEVNFLEAELDLKRRQLQRLIPKEISEDEIRSLCDPELSINADLVALVCRAEEVKQVIASKFSDPVTCHYDHPKNLLVTVHYPNRPSVTIDVLKSLRANPNNLHNPLIAGAIAHYARMARRQTESARTNLERITKALGHGKPLRSEGSLLGVEVSIYLNALPEKYFDSLWRILISNEAVDLKTDERQWFNHIQTQIQSEYPEVEHAKILDFLRDSSEMIPPHCGGNPAGAFKNAILHSVLSLDPASVKTMRSSNPLYRLRDNPFSENEWDQMADEYIRTLIADLSKTSTVKPYEDLSNLVKVKARST